MTKTALLVLLSLSRIGFAASATATTAKAEKATDAKATSVAATATAAADASAAPEPELPPSPCRVQARAEHTQAGGTCPPGELMTGVEKVSPLTLHCAAIDVRCDAPTRFLAAEPPAVQTAVPATPEKNVELMPPPPTADDKN